MKMHEFFYRLGQLKERCKNRPTQKRLVEEIYNEFARYDYAPNYVELFLKHHYSHRLLKKTFEYLGYRTSAKPCCQILHIWRIGVQK